MADDPMDAIDKLMEATPLQTCAISSGETLSYRVYNQEKETRYTLVVLGGYAGDGSILAAELAVLPQFTDHFLMGVNPRGWGASTQNQVVYTHKENADDVQLLLDNIGVKKCMVLGHSTGGPIAALLAIRNPERIQASFLKSSIPLDGMRVPMLSEQGQPLGRNVLTDQDMAIHCTGLRVLGFLSEDQETCHRAWSRITSPMPDVGTPAMRRFHSSASSFCADVGAKSANTKFNVTPIKTLRAAPSDLLQTLQVPIVVLHGSNDTVVPTILARSVTHLAIAQGWAPRGQLSYYEHAGGHFPLLEENPQEWANVYRTALQEQVEQQS